MKTFLLKIILFGIVFWGIGCAPKNDVVSNKLRISTEKIYFPINTENPVPLKFEDGYFDTFVSLFSLEQWQKCQSYNLIVTFNGFSIVMKNDEWILRREDGQDITMGAPNLPMLQLRGINKQKTPVLFVKPNWLSQSYCLIQFPQGSYSLSDDGILEIPILFRIVKSNSELHYAKAEFIVHSNWYHNGRR